MRRDRAEGRLAHRGVVIAFDQGLVYAWRIGEVAVDQVGMRSEELRTPYSTMVSTKPSF
jgi:hypothetical protein